MKESIWTCKIGGLTPKLSDGADLPMRAAVRQMFKELTGVEPEFNFSGWAGELTEMERKVVEGK